MITDNTAKWNVKKITDFGSTPGIPIGFEFFTTNPNLPEGFLPLLGGEFNRELYPALWSLVQEQSNRLISETEWQAKATANDNVSFYSTGDGSTTFRVPSITVQPESVAGTWIVKAYGYITNIENQDLTEISDAFSKVVTVKVWD